MSAEQQESLAERLSWTSGEFTRWSPDAHPDHNRWSWRGDGHGKSMRAEHEVCADAALSWVREVLEDRATFERVVRGTCAVGPFEEPHLTCSLAVRAALREVLSVLEADRG